MTQLKILAAILIILGLFKLFNVQLVELLDLLTKPMQKRQRMKNRINQITGKKQGLIQRQIKSAKGMLESAGMGGDFKRYQLMAMGLAVLGFLIGTILANLMAAIVLMLGMALVPIIVVRIKTGSYIRQMNESVETALSVVTNAYVQSGDLIDAVKTSLSAIPAPMDDVFKRFLVDVEFIDNNVVQAIYNMSDRIELRHFKDWCMVAVQSQSDRQLRYAMPSIVERLSDYRQIQMEADTAMRQLYIDYFIIVSIVVGSIPLLMNKRSINMAKHYGIIYITFMTLYYAARHFFGGSEIDVWGFLLGCLSVIFALIVNILQSVKANKLLAGKIDNLKSDVVKKEHSGLSKGQAHLRERSEKLKELLIALTTKFDIKTSAASDGQAIISTLTSFVKNTDMHFFALEKENLLLKEENIQLKNQVQEMEIDKGREKTQNEKPRPHKKKQGRER